MKKLFVALLAVAGLTACATEDVVRVKDSSLIAFDGVFVENATRAGDPSTTTANINEFYVWAVMDEANGIVFGDEKVWKAGDSWTYTQTQYWAPGHHYYFSAIVGDRSNDQIKLDFAAENGMSLAGLGTATFTNVAGINDVLYAEYDYTTENPISAEPAAVHFQFAHLLSKVKFTFDNAFTNDNNTIVITNVQMTAPAQATIDLTADEFAWTNHADVVTLAMGDVAAADRVAAGSSAATDNERLTIPAGANQEYTVTFKIQQWQGSVLATEADKTIKINGVELLPGRGYNFKATINEQNVAENPLYEIKFDVEVDEWVEEDVEGGVVATNAVSTEAELNAAVAKGGLITLAKDINLENAVQISNANVTLELNGKTLTTTKADEPVLWVRTGGVLTVNGEGTIEAKDSDAIYAAGDAKVVINGGTILSPVSTVYAAGSANVVINGGVHKVETTEYWNQMYTLNLKDSARTTASIVVKGGEYFNFNPANNAAEGEGTNFVAEGYYANKLGDWYVVAAAVVVDSAEAFAEALKSDAETINVKLYDNLDVAISSLGTMTGGSGEYKLGGENTKNITIDLNGKKLNITTTYWSNLGAKNNDAVFTIKNGTMTSSQPTGTWNSYDVSFSNCNYVIEDVVFEKAVAFCNAGKNVSIKNVTINETHDYYAMWISAKGQNVTIDGLTVESLGRGIKIDEQYVSAPAKVTLTVKNSKFTTAKKAAILVKSVAGAEVNVENVDIAGVAADSVNAVWVDADAAAHADKVVVNGASCIVEA